MEKDDCKTCCDSCKQGNECEGLKSHFTDVAILDGESKTILSVRDGVYEYLGAEIGQEPPHKVFKVYRSPDSVKKLSLLMNGLPITDGHVSLEADPEDVVTTVDGTEVIAWKDADLSSTVMIKNRVKALDSVLSLKQQGKNELSLGFKANLVPHETYDFEQTEFEPHHLAVLERGRCGSSCRFIDHKPEEKDSEPMKQLKEVLQSFKDADGEVTLQQILEMVAALPEAIRSVPMEKLTEVAPALKEIITAAQEVGVEVMEEASEEEMPASDMEEETMDMEEGSEEIPASDMEEGEEEVPSADMEEEVPAADMEEEDEKKKMAMADGVTLFNDAQVKEAIASAVSEHSTVIEKARQFVDQDFQFSGKSTEDIQREVLALHTEAEFADSAEVAIAFKLLQSKSNKYQGFADEDAASKFDKLKEKEI